MRAVALLLALAVAAPLRAQQSSGAWSLDFTLGAGQGNIHNGAVVEGAIAHQGQLAESAFQAFGGFAVAGDGLANQGDSCRLGILDACLPPLTFRSYSVLGGLRGNMSGVSVGAGVGAGVYSSNDNSTSLGYQVRGELSLPASSAVAFLASARHSWLPNYGNGYEFSAVTIGLRIRVRD